MHRSSSQTVLAIGLVFACVALFIGCVQVTVLDERALASTAGPLLHTPRIAASMRPRAALAIGETVPTGAGLDPGQLDAVTSALFDEPAFQHAFSGGLAALSRHVFRGEQGPIELDPVAARAGVAAALERVDPAAAALVAPGPGPTVSFDTTAAPDLSALASGLRVAGTVAGVLAAILVVVGLALSDRRTRAVARIGRWTAAAGLGVVVVFWLLPELAFPLVGGWTEVAGVVMSSGAMLLLPGLTLTVAGIVVTLLANRLIALGREHTLAVVPKAPMRRSTPADRDWRNSA